MRHEELEERVVKTEELLERALGVIKMVRSRSERPGPGPREG